MDMEAIKALLTLEQVMEWIQDYRSFGVFPGFLLVFLEAFLPFLPLFLFVMANASAFGLWLGFLISWVGACSGALLVFLIVRTYGQQRIVAFIHRHKKVKKLMNWVEDHGFGPLFLVLCFPFTPSALINIVAGLSNIHFFQYMIAVLAGKMVMIFTISFIGHDVISLIRQPFKTVVVIIIIFILWLVGKGIEKKIQVNSERKLRS
ncbi:TVP38/TMEM64 family protein [Aeribacillus pallidus]|jgi:uncharacterized membrane protein YdjX (TVP38/TMEM64 family)|uniref:TVP38/TMEM64 family protein n=1 Tax=Aeribacillus pallidus TaxID=33936 RepID=UPI001D933E20|nr:TVP38/TMEM64 family protein [Bacillus sp. (in: firmicutes)]